MKQEDAEKLLDEHHWERAIRVKWAGKEHVFGGAFHGGILMQVTDWIMGQEACSRPRHAILTQINREKLVEFGIYYKLEFQPYDDHQQRQSYKDYF